MWLSGNDTIDDPGVYGSLKVGSPDNMPGGRAAHTMAMDPIRNIVWILGGMDGKSKY